MLFSTLMEIYRDWRRYNAGLNELRSLSDRELAISASLVPTSTEWLGKTPARLPEPAAFTTNARQTAGVCTCTKALNGSCPV